MLIFVRSSATEGSRFAVGRLGHGGSFRSVALKRSAGVEVEPACLWFQPLARLRPFESCGRCHHMRSWPAPSDVAYFVCVGRSAWPNGWRRWSIGRGGTLEFATLSREVFMRKVAPE